MSSPTTILISKVGSPTWLMRVVLLAGTVSLMAAALSFLALKQLPLTDFVEYWSAARLEISGENPYSPSAMYTLETQLGLKSPEPLMMWNPPWVLPFLLPFGLLSFNAARGLQLLLGLLAIFFSADWLWRFYGGAPDRRWAAWLLTALFAPATMALAAGQISPIVLLGIVGFLYLEERGMHLLAGASLLLVAFKPHPVYLVGVAVLVFAARANRWLLLLGGLLSLGAATGVALAFDHHVFAEYRSAWNGGWMLALYAPALGGLLRNLFGWEKYWLQSVPMIAGLFWMVWWLRSHGELSWKRDLPLLLTVSACTAPYAWLFDQVVLLPALVQCAVFVGRFRRQWVPSCILLYALVNVLTILLVFKYGLLTQALAWTAPLWLAIYIGVEMTAESLSKGEESRAAA